MNERQRATILASLRYWQHMRDGTAPDYLALEETANGTGEFEPLNVEEIDDLCDQVNR